MILHENSKLFQEAVRATAQRLEIPNIYIEKDYWVCYALKRIFEHSIGKETVFKGGTALSKCSGLIERFSEDIDLVVLSSKGDSAHKLTQKIRTISKVIGETLPEINVKGITHKMGMNRKTAHQYPKIFKGNYGQIRDAIIIEATWLGYFEPFSSENLQTYIYDTMLNTGQKEMVDTYQMQPFEVNVLDPKRTICEKIMSLVRFSYDDNPVFALRNKIRHIYDLHMLLQNKNLQQFFYATAFEDMLGKVGNDDVKSYRNNNAWLEFHPVKALIFQDVDKIWSELEKTYTSYQEFRGLVYGRFPEASAVKTTLRQIKQRVKEINWKVDTE